MLYGFKLFQSKTNNSSNYFYKVANGKVAKEKKPFGSPSATVANFTYMDSSN